MASEPFVTTSSRSSFWQLIAVSAAVGLVARAICVYFAPGNSYLPDHLDNLAWGQWAVEKGPWAIYDLPGGFPMLVQVTEPKTGKVAARPAFAPHAYNYPPGSAYLFWVQGALWQTLDSNVREQRLPAPLAQKIGVDATQRMRLLDTHASRIAGAVPAVVCDFVMAIGLAFLVRRLAGPERPMAAAGAFALTMIAPPIFLNSAFWTHTDSWIMAVLVWVLWAMLTRRFILTGVLMGLAIVIKAQAILFGPVLLFVFLALRFREGGAWRDALRLAAAGCLSIGVVGLLAGPFMSHDAKAPGNADGALRWFVRGYQGAIGAEAYARTTLNALNVWWLEWMAAGATGDALKSTGTLAGISKDWIGKGLLGVAILLTFFLCGIRGRWRDESWLICAFLVTFAAFVLPTRVHERYIYYCLPFVIALGMLDWRRWLAPLLALLIVGTAEMVSFGWLTGDPGPHRVATGLSVVAVVTLLYSFGVAAWPARAERVLVRDKNTPAAC